MKRLPSLPINFWTWQTVYQMLTLSPICPYLRYMIFGNPDHIFFLSFRLFLPFDTLSNFILPTLRDCHVILLLCKTEPVWSFKDDNYGNFYEIPLISTISVSVGVIFGRIWRKTKTTRIRHATVWRHWSYRWRRKKVTAELAILNIQNIPWKMCLVECLYDDGKDHLPKVKVSWFNILITFAGNFRNF